MIPRRFWLIWALLDLAGLYAIYQGNLPAGLFLLFASILGMGAHILTDLKNDLQHMAPKD